MLYTVKNDAELEQISSLKNGIKHVILQNVLLNLPKNVNKSYLEQKSFRLMKWLNDDSLIFIAVEGSENQINNWYCLNQNV